MQAHAELVAPEPRPAGDDATEDLHQAIGIGCEGEFPPIKRNGYGSPDARAVIKGVGPTDNWARRSRRATVLTAGPVTVKSRRPSIPMFP